MGIPLRVKCICGRGHVHCIVCGTSNIYNVKGRGVETSDTEKFPSGSVRGFRCRNCGAVFLETQECAAPRPTRSSTEKAVSEVAQLAAERPHEEWVDEVKKLLKFGLQKGARIIMDKHGITEEEVGL